MPTATARHILVSTEAECLQLNSLVRPRSKPADARKNSSCPSRMQGGDLGTFVPGQVVREFDEVVFSGEINKVLGPVRTQFGYYRIEITKRW